MSDRIAGIFSLQAGRPLAIVHANACATPMGRRSLVQERSPRAVVCWAKAVLCMCGTLNVAAHYVLVSKRSGPARPLATARTAARCGSGKERSRTWALYG